jgi:hypothetical protein
MGNDVPSELTSAKTDEWWRVLNGALGELNTISRLLMRANLAQCGVSLCILADSIGTQNRIPRHCHGHVGIHPPRREAMQKSDTMSELDG